MARVFYDKAPVEIRVGDYSETLIATDCSINFNNSQAPVYAVGKKRPIGQFPAAARAGDISFNFLTSITGTFDAIVGISTAKQGNIINYLADHIKNSADSEASGVTIKCAGVSGIGFLNSYSFNTTANSISSSSASFTLFGSGSNLPVSGRLSGVSAGVGIGTDANQDNISTGIAHGRYTTMPTTLNTTIYQSDAALGERYATGTIYSADYSISFNHSPIYKIGQEFPTTTFYNNASESINVAEDVFNSGLKYDEDNKSFSVELRGLDVSKPGMFVRVTKAKQVSTSASVGLDDIIRTQKSLTAAY
tara:strand:+ start:881 stop:1798 length:918 start_codon:yes stop_codon:yes gene_type:complete